jgi:serine/threonine protein kinase
MDMAVGLEHVHDSGFMHLDFKTENVMVSRNGKVRLIDFDLALPIPKASIKLSKNTGTPSYMAPEQLKRQAIDHRVDIFAFGVTAYELLTGSKPFPGENPEDVLRQQLDIHFLAAPRSLNPDIPTALEKTILKCLERDPNKRHPIMSVLVHADIDGDKLTDWEIVMGFILLVTAGNDSTKAPFCSGMKALMEHPGERDKLLADPGLIPAAVEE